MAGTKITPSHSGPLRVEGDFEIVDPGGKPFGLAGRTKISLCRCGLAGRTKISLCRCGHSANKPFCDGTHKVVGFTDDVHARDLLPPVPPAPKP
jgi:CDGSH-type Zn-finger protein